jgi:hypothetical protein
VSCNKAGLLILLGRSQQHECLLLDRQHKCLFLPARTATASNPASNRSHLLLLYVVLSCRALLGGICEFLRIHAEQPELSVIITPAELEEATTPRPQDLPAAAAAAEAARAQAAAQQAAGAGKAGGLLAGAAGSCVGGSELEWCARGLLWLSCKVR